MRQTGTDHQWRTTAPLARAACGYWHRRGLRTAPGQVVAAPSGAVLLLALLAATEAPGDIRGPHGGVLLPRPSAAWYAPQVRLLGRSTHRVPVPAECGGVPDPVVLLESLRRARAGGEDPRVLLLSVADDPTGTTAPPELLHEVCEAAADEGLLIVSDESGRDTSYDPHATVIVSPAEILGTEHADSVVILADLSTTLTPPATSAGLARYPATPYGMALADRTRAVLAALRAHIPGPLAESAATALDEPVEVRRRRAAEARTHRELAEGLYRAVTEAGALSRPPQLGRHLYADLEPVRPRLAAHGVEDAVTLEAELVRRLGPAVQGGHRFGDDPHTLRVRLCTDLPAEVPEPGAGSRHTVRSALGCLTRAPSTMEYSPP